MSKAKELIAKIKKNSTIAETAVLTKSTIYGHKSAVTTRVPMINVALSGKVDGGLTSGLTVIAGPSKHFKSSFMLLLCNAFLEANPEDGVILFYDSEFGTPASYVQNFGIDPEKIVHSPIMNIEDLKFDIVTQLEAFAREDKVMIIIDSIGNLASKKELDNALNQNTAADMTRARELKSSFRMITPFLTMKDIPMVVVNHTYQTQEMYSKAVVSGGTGIYYSADNIWIVGRQQEKDGTEIVGWNFVINVEKSRFVKEKAKIPIAISYESGINRWSGLLDLALEGQYIAKPSNGWFQLVDRETGELVGDKMRRAELDNNSKLWNNLLTNTDFPAFIESQFAFNGKALADDVEDDAETETLENNPDDDSE